jgi:hypothetical protein
VPEGSTHVDFAILEALLQILVDCLIRHFANQCQVRDSDFLLLGALENGLLCELRLLLPTSGGFFLAPCALGYCLCTTSVSMYRGEVGACALVGRTMADAQLRRPSGVLDQSTRGVVCAARPGDTAAATEQRCEG